jgi:hypothetical protein
VDGDAEWEKFRIVDPGNVWTTETVVAEGYRILVDTGFQFVFAVATGGTTGAVEPTWMDADLGPLFRVPGDDSVTWVLVGVIDGLERIISDEGSGTLAYSQTTVLNGEDSMWAADEAFRIRVGETFRVGIGGDYGSTGQGLISGGDEDVVWGDLFAPLSGTIDPSRAAANEEQQVVVNGSPGSGTYTMMFGASQSDAITVGDNEAAVQTAIDTISPDLVVTGNWETFTVEFTGAFAATNVQLMEAIFLTGDVASVDVIETVAGHVAGLTASLLTFYLRDNAGTGELWFKTGAADTDWTQVI